MSQEFVIRFHGTLINQELRDSFGITGTTRKYDQNALGLHSTILEVVDAAELIPIGDITTEGFLYLKNLGSGTGALNSSDGADYIVYGKHGDSLPFKIKAGEEAWLRVNPGSQLGCSGNVSSVTRLQMKMFED